MPVGYGNFTVGDLFPQIMEYCAGRQFPDANMIRWVYRSVLELSKDYWFQGLQATGPYVNFVTGQFLYEPSFFQQAGDAALDINKVVSFFMYYQVGLTSSTIDLSYTNPGVQLKYREIASAENTMAIQSFPSYWSRWQGQVFISPNPVQAFLCFMRYQKQHPWTLVDDKPAPTADDVIMLDDDWQDIVEYCAAMRAAFSVRLFDIASAIKTLLYGDPDFQRSGGLKGQPGLIFGRVSQYQRDSITATRSIQIRRA
ncbi:MAG TPA: hypothetical protein VGF75_00090 [Candidatus Saccharimonadales bacterium]